MRGDLLWGVLEAVGETSGRGRLRRTPALESFRPWLATRPRRVPWSTFVEVLAAVHDAAGADVLTDLGARAFASIRVPTCAFLDRDHHLIRLVSDPFGPLRLEGERLWDDRLHLHATLDGDAGEAQAAAFFVWLAGAIGTVANPFGGVPRTVSYQVEGGAARYEVEAPRAPLGLRLGQAARVLWSGQEGLGAVRTLEAELRLREVATERALRELRFEVDNRDRFLRNLSHELRGPLHGLIGLTRSLQGDAPGPEERAQLLADLERVTGHLEGLASGLFDYARVADEDAHPHVRPFRLERVVERLVAYGRGRAEARGLSFRHRAPPDAEGWLHGDDRRIEVIARRAIDNACDFSRDGRVELRIDLLEDPLRLELQLLDEGCGIPEQHLDRVFEPFFQLQPDFDRGGRGFGLGLTVLKRDLETMGGEVALDSALGQGTTVRMRIPVERIEHLPSQRPARRTLLVEDDPVAARILQRLGDRLALEIVPVATGEEALARLEAETFDVLLLDCELPGMDGWEVARRVRRRLGLSVMIVAVTAHASEQDMARCLEAGMDDVVLKPVDPRRVLEALQRWS